MAVYTTAKCGHCGENWTKLNPNAPNTVFGKIGPPVIRCVSCLKDNKTGYKLIRDLNLLEKLLTCIHCRFGFPTRLISTI